jgi:hypothetical protein
MFQAEQKSIALMLRMVAALNEQFNELQRRFP